MQFITEGKNTTSTLNKDINYIYMGYMKDKHLEETTAHTKHGEEYQDMFKDTKSPFISKPKKWRVPKKDHWVNKLLGFSDNEPYGHGVERNEIEREKKLCN